MINYDLFELNRTNSRVKFGQNYTLGMGPDDDDESVDGEGSKLDQVLDLKDAKRTVE